MSLNRMLHVPLEHGLGSSSCRGVVVHLLKTALRVVELLIPTCGCTRHIISPKSSIITIYLKLRLLYLTAGTLRLSITVTL